MIAQEAEEEDGAHARVSLDSDGDDSPERGRVGLGGNRYRVSQHSLADSYNSDAGSSLTLAGALQAGAGVGVGVSGPSTEDTLR
jgi:hypothetical protein